MNCDKTNKISQMFDGELSAEESEQIKAHLENCAGCQSAQQDFLFFREQIKTLAQNSMKELNQAVSLSLWQRIFQGRLEFSFSVPVLGLILLILISAGIWTTFRKDAKETVATDKSKQTPVRKENPGTEKASETSLARYDHGGRAEVYIVQRNPEKMGN